jgi:hypothetical protein
MNERQILHIERNKQKERIKKLRDKRHKTDAEMQEEVLMEAKRILGLL